MGKEKCGTYIYTIEKHYSAIKRTEILCFAKTWMNLVIITLSELSWHRKTNNT
jgi:hypothetical protein